MTWGEHHVGLIIIYGSPFCPLDVACHYFEMIQYLSILTLYLKLLTLTNIDLLCLQLDLPQKLDFICTSFAAIFF